MALLDGAFYIADLRVKILGIDVTDDVSKVNGIEQLLDFPTPTQFVADDVEIVLADINGRYNPQRPDNFFAHAAAKINGEPLTNDDGEVIDLLSEFPGIEEFTFSGSGINWSRYRDSEGNYVGAIPKQFWRDGYYAPVDIFLARADNTDDVETTEGDKIFSGVIIDIDFMSDPPTTRIIVSDHSQFLRRAQIKDFGIERALRPVQHPDFRIQDGVYHIPGGHISEDSVVDADTTKPFYFTLNAGGGNDQKVNLEYVKEKGLAGASDFNSFTLDLERGLLTGGVGDFPQHPNVRFKQAYRYKTVEAIVRELVAKYVDSGADPDIKIPDIYFKDRVYQSNGNLSYFLEGHTVDGFPTGDTQYNQWRYATPTKFGFSASAGDKGRFYFEYRGANYHYDVATDTFDNTSDTPTYATGNPSNAQFRNGHFIVGGRDHGLCWRSVLGDPLDFPEHFYGMHVNHIAGTYVVESRIDGETDYHIIAGYGALKDTTKGDIGTASDALTRLDFTNGHILLNWQWITLSRRCNQKLPLLETNGRTAWDILQDLARLTNCVIGFEPVPGAGKSRFFFRPADNVVGDMSEHYEGATQSLSKTDTDTLILDNAESFPDPDDDDDVDSYNILAVSQPGTTQQEVIEVLSYSGKSGTRQLTDLVRSEDIAGTPAQQLDYPTRIYLIQGIIRNDIDETKGNLIDVNIDANFEYLANDIRVRYGGSEVYPATNEDSVKGYREHYAEFNFPMLDFHQGDWAEWIGDGYLADYSKANYYINAVITLNPDIAVGDMVVLFQEARAHLSPVGCRAMQVMHDYDKGQTHIAALTVFRHSRIAAEEDTTTPTGNVLAFGATNNILRIWQTDGYHLLTLPGATGGTLPYRYALTMSDDSDLRDGFGFEPTTLELYTTGRYTSAGVYEGFGPPEGAYSFKYKVIDSSEDTNGDPAELEYPGEIEIAFEGLDTWSALAASGRRMYVVGSDKCRVLDTQDGRVFSGSGSGFSNDLGLPANSNVIDATIVSGTLYLLTDSGGVLSNSGGSIASVKTLPTTGEWFGIAAYSGSYVVLDNTTGKLMASDGTTEVADLGVVGNYKAIEIVGTTLYALLADCSYILTWNLGVGEGENTQDFGSSIALLRGSGEWVGLAYSDDNSMLYAVRQNATRAIAINSSGNRDKGSDVPFFQ